MDYHPKLDVGGHMKGQLFVESSCLFIMLQKQKFVHPIENEVENATEEVQDRHSGRVHQHAE
jgi:hypothetical protein